jgi:hypothetical protein
MGYKCFLDTNTKPSIAQTIIAGNMSELVKEMLIHE